MEFIALQPITSISLLGISLPKPDLWYDSQMTIRTAIYARSSPGCPMSADEQIEQLKTIACAHGWVVAHVFADRPMTVRKGLDRRPGEVALIQAIRSHSIDKVLILSICRIAKSLVDLVAFMETCRSAGVAVYLHEQNVDSATSNGIALFDLSAMLAQHLRQSRRDRILRGQAAARSQSIRFGRPPIPASKIQKAKIGLAAGHGVRHVARLAGISAASVSRLNGSGLWLIAKRLEKGRFVWPPIVDGAMTLTPAQFSVLIEAMDWRRTIAPALPI